MAHFYNTIDQQMIPSQRPMMLGLALAFEQVIKVHSFFFSPPPILELLSQKLGFGKLSKNL